MRFIYLFSVLALALTFGCNNPAENDAQTSETTSEVAVDNPAADAVVEENSDEIFESEADSTSTEDAEEMK